MSHFMVEGPTLKCSKCGSTDIEGVTYGTVSFPRCRACKHEGDHKSMLAPFVNSILSSNMTEQPKEIAF